MLGTREVFGGAAGDGGPQAAGHGTWASFSFLQRETVGFFVASRLAGFFLDFFDAKHRETTGLMAVGTLPHFLGLCLSNRQQVGFSESDPPEVISFLQICRGVVATKVWELPLETNPHRWCLLSGFHVASFCGRFSVPFALVLWLLKRKAHHDFQDLPSHQTYQVPSYLVAGKPLVLAVWFAGSWAVVPMGCDFF